jgi:hypothetical protein
MTIRAQRVRAADGTERVLVDLVDFQALLDAADTARHGLPDVAAIVRRLASNLEANEETVDLDQFLASYDALHGTR